MTSEADTHFAAFVDREHTELLRIGWYLTSDPDDARDLVQEALTRVYRRWATLCPGEAGLSLLTQAPGWPLVLDWSTDPGHDLRPWGASVLEVPGQADVVAIVPEAAQRVTFAGGEPVERLTPVLDDQDQVLAQVARVSPGEDENPPALLWRTGDDWSLRWHWPDVVLGPVEAPAGAWAMHLTDDERGDAFVGWVPEQTEKLVINGEPGTC